EVQRERQALVVDAGTHPGKEPPEHLVAIERGGRPAPREPRPDETREHGAPGSARSRQVLAVGGVEIDDLVGLVLRHTDELELIRIEGRRAFVAELAQPRHEEGSEIVTRRLSAEPVPETHRSSLSRAPSTGTPAARGTFPRNAGRVDHDMWS